MTLTYDYQLCKFAEIIKIRVGNLAKQYKIPHVTVWQDLDVILSVDDVRESAKQEFLSNNQLEAPRELNFEQGSSLSTLGKINQPQYVSDEIRIEDNDSHE